MLKDHKKDSNQERYKTLGYKQPFDGKAGSGSWSELIESMKTNVLRLNLRQRKLVMGKYTAQAGAAGDMKPLATIPEDWSESWDVTAKRRSRDRDSGGADYKALAVSYKNAIQSAQNQMRGEGICPEDQFGLGGVI